MSQLLVLCIVLAICLGAWADGPVVQRSDVVFMGSKTPDVYQAYGATMVSWGGNAGSEDPRAVAGFTQRVKDAHDLGIRYCAGLAFRTAFARMIDFDPNFMASVCRDLDGKPIVVPWLWDHSHKGNPAYWFCTNAPGYRAYLKAQCKSAMVTDVEGLHIDDYNGTAGTEWQGGCFCPHCMAAFRTWLKDNLSPTRQAELKIASLDDFDYGAWLRSQGITVAEYKKRVNSDLPLGREFMTFEYKAAAKWVGEIRQYAESLIGHSLMLSVNSSASGPGSLVIAPQLTYFCGEVGQGAASLTLATTPIFTYKLADAVGRVQVCTGSGQDWALIDEKKYTELVRGWIAQSYAFGNQLMAPHRQWAYTETKGTHWYQSQPSEYAPLYQFVRANAALFDGYGACALVGVLYSNAAFRTNRTGARNICMELARRNIPFRIVIAGDDWLDMRLRAEDLAGLKAVVVPDGITLDPPQQAVLDAAKDRLVNWPDEARLTALVGTPVSVEGAQNVSVVPREVPGDVDRPLVCHLLNRNFVAEANSTTEQTNVIVRISSALVGDRPVRKVTLYAPGKEATELSLMRTDAGLQVTVPTLGLWALLVIG